LKEDKGINVIDESVDVSTSTSNASIGKRIIGGLVGSGRTVWVSSAQTVIVVP
jgi:hypothetical protein